MLERFTWKSRARQALARAHDDAGPEATLGLEEALAPARRYGRAGGLLSEILLALGERWIAAGREEEGIALLRDALDLLVAAPSDDHLWPTAKALASALARRGDLAALAGVVSSALDAPGAVAGDPTALGIAAVVAEEAAAALVHVRRDVEAVSLARQALSAWERAGQGEALERRYVLSTLGLALLETGRADEALPVMNRLVALQGRHLHPRDQEGMGGIALLGMALVGTGRTDAAWPIVERLIATLRRPHGPTTTEHLYYVEELALRLDAGGSSQLAADLWFAIRVVAGREGPSAEWASWALPAARVLEPSGLAALEDALARAPRTTPREACDALLHLGRGALWHGRHDLAVAAFARVEARAAGRDEDLRWKAANLGGIALWHGGDAAAAAARFEREAAASADDAHRAANRSNLARVKLEQGRLEEAEQLSAFAVELADRAAPVPTADADVILLARADVLSAAGRFEEARGAVERARAIQVAAPATPARARSRTLLTLAGVLLTEGRRDEARAALVEAARLAEEQGTSARDRAALDRLRRELGD